MSDWVSKLLVLVSVFTVGLGIGGYIGTDAAQKTAAREKAELQAGAAEQMAALEKQYREKEKENAQKVADAISERDKALSAAADLRGDLDGVRKSAEAYRKRLSGTASAGKCSCQSYRAKLGRCTELLEESAGLLQEGADLSGRVAADHDALAKIVK